MKASYEFTIESATVMTLGQPGVEDESGWDAVHALAKNMADQFWGDTRWQFMEIATREGYRGGLSTVVMTEAM